MMSLALVVLMGTGHAADVRLAWNASPEPDIAGYKIYYGTASRVYDWSIDAKKVTTFTVSGLADGRTYYFAVTAYDTSNLESTYSNEVSTSTCRYSISPPGQSFPASGGTGSINVSTQSACSWNASSNVSWMTITSGSRGTGNGTVYYSINANSDSSSRTASSTIAKNTFTVTQEGNSTTTYTITASAGTGGTISPAGTVTVSRNASRSFTITPSTGYSIDRVIVDGSSVGAVSTYTFSNVTANHTISASFKADTTTYTITASAGTGGTISPAGTVTVSRNASRSFTITPSTGYSIDRVIVDGSSVGAVSTYTFSNVTANHTISASFKADTTKYTLTINRSGSGTGTVSNNPSGLSFARGTVVTLTATPDAGSSFVGWSGGCSGTTPTCTVTMSANVIVTATFNLVSGGRPDITITSPSGGETLSAGSTWTIVWEATPDIVKFDLSYLNGLTWRSIARGVTGSRYQWQIPALARNLERCKVRIVGYNVKGKKIASAKSIGTFAIKVVKLTSLNGGQEVVAGSSQTIQWTTYAVTHDAPRVRFSYTLDGGRKWKKIKGFVENAGKFIWTVPVTEETHTECKVRVILETGHGVKVGSDESESFFRIRPAS
ncbi:MAG TPA: fibronectin type III domain-containing protein [Syntrophorhabdus sp.]|nr:fibronectin type III domain-containing protein [Syntrophorhabdus sp.]HQM26695.1 fibronectin type III domain-containing protein [Syntrophorhabdus sp.]